MDHAMTALKLYELVSTGDIDGFGAYLAEDFVEHEELPGLASDRSGVLDFFRLQIAAFPDLSMDAQDVIASGDKVAARVKVTGTHQGDFMGIPATGNSVNVQLVDIFLFGDDGLVHGHWGVTDLLSMMQQLGAIPSGP